MKKTQICDIFSSFSELNISLKTVDRSFETFFHTDWIIWAKISPEEAEEL